MDILQLPRNHDQPHPAHFPPCEVGLRVFRCPEY